ncbi:tRNA pseudouridine(38-40) synthase TruA [Demequina sp. B12]|uniref:tRNA pseudouridine(38-40) synthase TruA n=1 Tax=Demequina sp. B12 TaxID=2992757 RepID=UPI00237BEA3C|nr:tRNA pseudouridine(38-40) synthase TruA [Demequina sp. B12]MDE0572464.1 tRNA pseudouridine(38-40) synthase TruA [Demequina sp. B12]
MTELDSSDVVRARLVFSYDGTDFAGWAAQPALRTVQGELEAGLSRIVRDPATGEPAPLRLTVAGRTDAGVHARGQVAHVDVPAAAWAKMPGRSDRTPEVGLRDRLDGVTPADITVHDVTVAPEGFDARFSATERRYAYRVCDDRALRDPLARRHVWWVDDSLDIDSLNAASATLTGLRDFAAFCKAREGATSIRELKEFSWARLSSGPDTGLVVATVRADAFCHSMVRSLVGAVMPVGQGRRDLTWLAEVAESAARSQAVAVAPAHGLTLEQVSYPADADLGSRASRTRARRDSSDVLAGSEGC